MKLLFIFVLSLLSANLFSQTNPGFDWWSGFGHWTGFGPHAFGHINEVKPIMDVGEKPCLSYEPCEGAGYATGAGYGYGMTPVYTIDIDNETTGYGHSFYQRPYYNNYLNDSGRGYNQKFDLRSPASANFEMLPRAGTQQ